MNDPLLQLMAFLYLSPLLAGAAAFLALRRNASGFKYAVLILAFLLALFFADGTLLFINDRRVMPFLFNAIYALLWYAILTLPKAKIRKWPAIPLGMFHALLIPGVLGVMFIVGDSFQKLEVEYAEGPIRIYNQRWGFIGGSGTAFNVTAKIPGCKLVERLLYGTSCGDGRTDTTDACGPRYVVRPAGDEYQVELVFKDRTERWTVGR